MVNKCVRFFRMALIALGISAVSLLLIPMINNQLVQYALAGLFWISLVEELVLFAIGNHIRRKIEQINPRMKPKRKFGRIGLICFAQNKEALIVDLLLLASAVYMIAISMLRVNSLLLVLLGILAIYVFFCLHCVLNGILYKSIKHYSKVIHKRRERK